MKIRLSLGLALSGGLLLPLVAHATPTATVVKPAVENAPVRKTLPNGLTVLVLENHTAPVVAVRAYVQTGSIYENQYLGAGLSHLFEHTLFDGTTTRNETEINNELQAIGGQSNAYTSYDVTAYHVATATPYLKRAVGVLADMLRNANFPDAQVKMEQGVIHNEMNLDEDDPSDVASELWEATAFQVHPVRYPIIGYRELFDRLTRADILSYYHDRYTPQNTVLSVAGDVNPQDVFAAAEDSFGSWQRGTGMRPTLPVEPRQGSPRRAVIERDVAQTYLELGWHTVPLQSPDIYALDVLAQLLGGGESSRLVRDLRENLEIVSDISASSDTPNYDAGSFGISAELPPENEAKVQAAIAAQIARARQTAPTLEEVKRAQRQTEAAFIFGKSDVENQAEQMALDTISTGDPTYSRFYVQRIQAVTPAQVLAVARKYLRPDGITTAIVRPRRTTATKPPAASPVTSGASAVAAGQPTQLYRLPNGLRVLVRINRSSPTVGVVLSGLGGVRAEAQGKAGSASLAAELLTRDTQKRSAEQVAALVDSLGGSLDSGAGYNTWTISSQWLQQDWTRGISLLAEGALTPAFKTDELSRVRTQTLAGIAEQAQDPLSRASLMVRGEFYGKDSPYGRAATGVPSQLKKLTRADVTGYWARTMQPQNTVLSIYGDVDAAQVRRVVQHLFGGWKNTMPKATLPATLTEPFAPLVTPVEAEETVAGASQTGMFYAFPGPDARSDDRYALDVLDAALSGAGLPGGRIFQLLRDEQLVYDANAFSQAGLGSGSFWVYAGTTRPNQARTKQILEEELKKVREADIKPEELENAKSMCIAEQALGRQGNIAQAESDASNELLGLGYNDDAAYAARINAVTLSDVRRMAEKYLDFSHAAFALAGPPEGTPVQTAPLSPKEPPSPTPQDPTPDGASPRNIPTASPVTVPSNTPIMPLVRK